MSSVLKKADKLSLSLISFLFQCVFQTAVENGSDVVADILLERGARIDILTPNHQTLLHLAVSPKVNNPVMLEMLLERGLDVNAQNSYGETPLMQAARSSSLGK